MRTPRVYQAQALAANTVITLDVKVSHHIGRVLRLKAGNALHVFDGHGHEFVGIITEVSKRQVLVHLQQALTPIAESPLAIHLGQAISRGSKMDMAIQKAVELGVNEISPVLTEHCAIKRSSQQLDNKMSHWQAIIIHACEQCGRAQLPLLNPPVLLDDWLQQTNAELSLVLAPNASSRLADINDEPKSIRLLIGPEGGLSQQEIERTIAHHFSAITLGPRILRTETATLTAISLLQARWGDLA